MAENNTKSKSQTKVKLVLDLIIFFIFLIAMDPRSSGIAIHEWLATSAIAALVVHLLLSWDWIVNITRRFVGKVNSISRINYILNWLLFIDGTIIMLSGFMISESLLPYLGIHVSSGFAWRRIHDISANFFLLLLGAHTALHWSWIVDTSKRYVFRLVGRLFATKKKEDVTA